MFSYISLCDITPTHVLRPFFDVIKFSLATILQMYHMVGWAPVSIPLLVDGNQILYSAGLSTGSC